MRKIYASSIEIADAIKKAYAILKNSP